MKLDDENWHVLTVSRRDPVTGQYTMEKAPLYHLVDTEESEDLEKIADKDLVAAE
jgi:adenylylsulfate reductase subunit A